MPTPPEVLRARVLQDLAAASVDVGRRLDRVAALAAEAAQLGADAEDLTAAMTTPNGCVLRALGSQAGPGRG